MHLLLSCHTVIGYWTACLYFYCFYPYEKILSHTPSTRNLPQSCTADKQIVRKSDRKRHKDNIKTQQPTLPSSSIWLMTSPCYIRSHLSILRISWKTFSFGEIKKQYLRMWKNYNPWFVWGSDRKIRPSRSSFVTTEQAPVVLRKYLSMPSLHLWWILIFLHTG